jgi:hypothetical protein
LLISSSSEGKEKDPIAFVYFLVGSFLQIPGAYVKFSHFMGSFVKIVHPPSGINESFYALRGAPCSKKKELAATGKNKKR